MREDDRVRCIHARVTSPDVNPIETTQLTTDNEIRRVVRVVGLAQRQPLSSHRHPTTCDTHHEPLVHLHRLVHRSGDGIFMDLLKRRQGQVLGERRGHDLRCETLV